MSHRRDAQVIAAAVFAAACCLSTGCSLFRDQTQPQLTAEVKPGGPEAAKPAAPSASFTVEVRPESGKPIAKEQPLEGPLTVQEALEHTKANKRFARFNLELYRPLPDGRIHSMLLKYDRTNKRVDSEYDYALLPGDRLVVVEDTTTIVDDVLDAVTMPVGGMKRFSSKNKPAGRYRTEG